MNILMVEGGEVRVVETGLRNEEVDRLEDIMNKALMVRLGGVMKDMFENQFKMEMNCRMGGLMRGVGGLIGEIRFRWRQVLNEEGNNGIKENDSVGKQVVRNVMGSGVEAKEGVSKRVVKRSLNHEMQAWRDEMIRRDVQKRRILWDYLNTDE